MQACSDSESRSVKAPHQNAASHHCLVAARDPCTLSMHQQDALSASRGQGSTYSHHISDTRNCGNHHACLHIQAATCPGACSHTHNKPCMHIFTHRRHHAQLYHEPVGQPDGGSVLGQRSAGWRVPGLLRLLAEENVHFAYHTCRGQQTDSKCPKRLLTRGSRCQGQGPALQQSLPGA